MVPIICPDTLKTWPINCSGTTKMIPLSCPETSVRNYHHSLRHSPDERSSQLLRGRSVKWSVFAVLFDFHYTTFNTQVQFPFQLVISDSITHKYLLTSEFKPARGHKVWAMRQLPFIARLGVTLGRWDVAPIFGLLLTDLPYQFYDKIEESSHINRRYVRELYF